MANRSKSPGLDVSWFGVKGRGRAGILEPEKKLTSHREKLSVSGQVMCSSGMSTITERLQTKKLFYKIGEVSEIIQVPTYVLRFWESEFKFLKPGKGRGRRRTYVERDIETVRTIKRLLYDEGYTLEGVRRQWGRKTGVKRGASSHTRLSGDMLDHVKAELNEVLKIIASYDGNSRPKRTKKPSGSGRSAAR